MLNILDIIRRVEQPATCSIEDLDDLRLMVEKFPYSQLFPILYLKALSNRKDIRFDEELTKYAYRITDRLQLYQLIREGTVLDKENTASGLETVTDISLSNDLKESALTAEELITEDDDITMLHETTAIVESIEDPSNIISEVTIDPGIASDEETEDVEIIPLNLSKFGDVLNQEIEIEENDSQFEKEILAETIASGYELTILKSENQIESEVKSENEDEFGNQIENENQSESEDRNALTDNISLQGKRSFSSWLRSSENDVQPLIDEEKARIESILEQFLENQPSISRPKKSETVEEKPKKEFYSAAKKAKESILMENMPVSETLARIFALQGNYPKAIFVYEQLVLINSEKKTFFATQIEELKKKLTN